MHTLRRLTILAIGLVLFAPGGARAGDAKSKIPEGIPIKGMAPLSKEESRALKARAEKLRREIARSDAEEALARLREALADAPPSGAMTKENTAYGRTVAAALFGIHDRLESPTGPVDSSYLALLREYVALIPEDRHIGLWDQAVLNWAASFAEMHGDQAIALAAQRANDPSLPPVDRGLHLVVFRITPAKDWDHPQRELALETYRPYLDPSAPPIMQEMAVMTARGLWDYDAVKDLEHLAFTSPSYRARSRARTMVGLLYHRGPRMQNAYGGGMPYNVPGARAWNARQEEYRRAFNRLIGMEDVAEHEKAEAARPPRPSVPIMPAEPGRSMPSDGLPHRPPPSQP